MQMFYLGIGYLCVKDIDISNVDWIVFTKNSEHVLMRC